MSEREGERNRRRGACLLACVSALACSVMFGLPGFASAADGLDQVAPKRLYASTFVSGRSGYRIIHYWSDGQSMRAETLIGGHPITTIVRGDRYWVFDRLSKKGLSVARAKQATKEEGNRGRPFGNEWEEIRAAGGERVGEERIGGAEVEVWQLTNEAGSRKVWVSKGAARVPFRVEVFDRRSSDTVKTDYSNWKLNLEIPGSFFEPEQGVDFESFGYEEFVTKAREERVGTVPVLYPDLLHGTPAK